MIVENEKVIWIVDTFLQKRSMHFNALFVNINFVRFSLFVILGFFPIRSFVSVFATFKVKTSTTLPCEKKASENNSRKD